MAQSPHSGAERTCLSPKSAAGHSPGFFPTIHGNPLPAGAVFGSAKTVTVGDTISPPAPALSSSPNSKGTPFPQQDHFPSSGFGFPKISGAPAPHLFSSSNGTMEPEFFAKQLGEFSNLPTTTPQKTPVSVDFTEEKASDLHRTKREIDTLEWQDHYARRTWSVRCRKYYNRRASWLRHILENIPSEINEVQRSINAARRILRRTKSVQLLFPDMPGMPAMPESLEETELRRVRDRYNALMRRKRDLETEQSATIKELQRINAYLEVLNHSVMTCRDFIIPHRVRRTLKNGEVKEWTTPSPGVPEVHMAYSSDNTLWTRFKWFRHCGSIFFCPVCSTRKNQQRRQGLQQVLDWIKERDLQVSFITLTVPHSHDSDMPDLVEKMMTAKSNMLSGKRWQMFCIRTGLWGFVHVLEATWSKRNGGNPHIHMLFAYSRPGTSIGFAQDPKQIEKMDSGTMDAMLPGGRPCYVRETGKRPSSLWHQGGHGQKP